MARSFKSAEITKVEKVVILRFYIRGQMLILSLCTTAGILLPRYAMTMNWTIWRLRTFSDRRQFRSQGSISTRLWRRKSFWHSFGTLGKKWSSCLSFKTAESVGRVRRGRVDPAGLCYWETLRTSSVPANRRVLNRGKNVPRYEPMFSSVRAVVKDRLKSQIWQGCWCDE